MRYKATECETARYAFHKGRMTARHQAGEADNSLQWPPEHRGSGRNNVPMSSSGGRHWLQSSASFVCQPLAARSSAPNGVQSCTFERRWLESGARSCVTHWSLTLAWCGARPRRHFIGQHSSPSAMHYNNTNCYIAIKTGIAVHTLRLQSQSYHCVAFARIARPSLPWLSTCATH
jgi:hypothetical protein